MSSGLLSAKANVICILKILEEYSDPNHILTSGEIRAKLEKQYGLKVDRRTLYGAIALLNDLGYDIDTYEDNKKGYYLRRRLLEPNEVALLTDAVYSFPFLTVRQSKELIEKLQNLLSVHQRKQYLNLTLVRQERKSHNRQVPWNMELLDEAIAEKKQVRFTFFEYGIDKKLHPRRKKPYVVNPYELVYTNEHYYLVCNTVGHENTSLYRMDLIRDIKKLDTPWSRKPEDKSEIRNAVYAFIGKPEPIMMHCDKDILVYVIDKFGTDIQVSPRDEKTVTVSVTVPPKGVKFWALQYLPHVEVVQPQWLRDEIVEALSQSRYS